MMNRLLSGIFHPSDPPPSCQAPSISEDEKQLLLLTNAISWCLLLAVLCVWQWKKRRNLRLRRARRRESLEESSSSLEHQAFVEALQEELQAKSVAENEQAILWRQEKRILQSRIDELLENQTTGDDGSSSKLHEAQLLQQVKELQETVTFLSGLTESQTEELESKQQEIDKLENILEELQENIEGGTTPTKNHNQVVGELAEVIATKTSCETTSEDDYDDDDDDDDDDSISIDSSVDGSAVAIPEEEEKDKCRLQEDNKVVLLMSSMPGNLSTSVHQSRLESIFRHGLQLGRRYLETIDGCDAAWVDLRNNLFQISGLHAVYPQVFLVQDNDIQFVGDFETILELHDARELPQRIGLLLPEDNNEDEKENIPNKYDNIGSILTENIAKVAAAASPHSGMRKDVEEKKE